MGTIIAFTSSLEVADIEDAVRDAVPAVAPRIITTRKITGTTGNIEFTDTLSGGEQTSVSTAITGATPETDHNVTFTGNRNNLPLRRFNYYTITATSPINITGIVASSHGRVVMATNIGSNTITLVNASASSLAANRIINPSGTNYLLLQNNTVILVYNTDVNRWGIVK